MFQGTGSDVGKSTLVAGLCRIAAQRGLRVAPFKPQNMSNNAAACKGGGEIGRAQALQARACGQEPHLDFNPVLLKPQSDRTAQVIVHGHALTTMSAKDYMTQQRATLMQSVLESFARLSDQYDLILIEGAGSPAEINLRTHDIANMGFAREVGSPVCLVGDIDRGGVIAAIAGTKQVIDRSDAKLISSFIINRFRGDPSLFDEGVRAIESITGWPCRGVVPWLNSALELPQEDAVVLDNVQHDQTKQDEKLLIAVPMLSRIANFDDLDPLKAEPKVNLVFVPPGTPIPLHADAIIIPGTKSTIADMQFMVKQGWDHDIIAIARCGGRILGVCGGYQLLGESIHDPQGVEGDTLAIDGLGLLAVSTTMMAYKSTKPVEGICVRSRLPISGYEIHMGVTNGKDALTPLFKLAECQDTADKDQYNTEDGALSTDGRVEGTYVHGLFSSDAYRGWWLDSLRPGASSDLRYERSVEQALDRLAGGLRQSLNTDALLSDARPARGLTL